MINGLWGRLLQCSRANRQSRRSPVLAKLIVVVEGRHDVEFLRRMSKMLHVADCRLPDLGEREGAGDMIFLPIGGGNIASWGTALAGLGLAELHIYDREVLPETELRRQAAEQVNKRPGCRAFVTGMRSLENYVHPLCIKEVSGLELNYNGDDDVAELAARGCYERDGMKPPWELLPGRARKRCKERAKRWLNKAAVDQMVPSLLDQRDPAGEVHRWLTAIAEMLRTR
jgi:putative ATP-dependent endonuclease of OLD family